MTQSESGLVRFSYRSPKIRPNLNTCSAKTSMFKQWTLTGHNLANPARELNLNPTRPTVAIPRLVSNAHGFYYGCDLISENG